MFIKNTLAVAAKIVIAGIAVSAFTVSNAMADEPFIGEIRAFSGNYCPRGWVEADGRLIQVADNPALYSIMGSIYGGDGRTTFGLPTLQGRVALGKGNGPGLASKSLGQKGGAETLSLAGFDIPAHTHSATTTTVIHASSSDGNTSAPSGALLADDGRDRIYNSNSPDVTLKSDAATSVSTVSSAGDSNPDAFTRRHPYIGIKYCIALDGMFPSRN